MQSSELQGGSGVGKALKGSYLADLFTKKEEWFSEGTALLLSCRQAAMQHLAALPSTAARGCSQCAVPGRSHSLTFEPLAGDRMRLAPAWATPGPELLTQRLAYESCATRHRTGDTSQVHAAAHSHVFPSTKGGNDDQCKLVTVLVHLVKLHPTGTHQGHILLQYEGRQAGWPKEGLDAVADPMYMSF
jgi:hypothetical protein